MVSVLDFYELASESSLSFFPYLFILIALLTLCLTSSVLAVITLFCNVFSVFSKVSYLVLSFLKIICSALLFALSPLTTPPFEPDLDFDLDLDFELLLSTNPPIFLWLLLLRSSMDLFLGLSEKEWSSS
jgi:hypothetical protein